jgi:AcrR family transcriptional regulator
MNDSQSVRRGTEARRAQLLDAARRCFVADGYAGTSISSVVRAAGVAQGTFYVYFDSKQAVLAELRRGVFRDYAEALASSASAPRAADARLVETVRSMARLVEKNLELERVFRQAESADELSRAAVDGRARLARAAAGFMAEGVAAGELEVDDPERTAELIVTLFDHVLYESLVYERPAPLSTTVELALRFVLRGLGVSPARVEHLLIDARRAGETA